MILGAKFSSWANFPWVFPKKRFAILKMIGPNSKGQNYFTLKIAKILYKL
jgi:hypothetical protein